VIALVEAHRLAEALERGPEIRAPQTRKGGKDAADGYRPVDVELGHG
jgi:hypothetical protein